MKKSRMLVNGVVGAALLTLVTAAGSLLFLMFGAGDEAGRREGLFGTVFFETKEVRPGVTGAEMGIDSPIGLVVLFLVLFGLVMVGQLCFAALTSYRAELIRERSHQGASS